MDFQVCQPQKTRVLCHLKWERASFSNNVPNLGTAFLCQLWRVLCCSDGIPKTESGLGVDCGCLLSLVLTAFVEPVTTFLELL